MPFNRSFSPLHWSCARLLLVAVAFHIVLILVVSLVGIYRVFPGTFNQEGVGISFAIDSISYHREASEMGQLLQQGRFRDWIDYPSIFPTTLHIRLYSLGFAVMGKLVGFRTLAAEPLNLIYYVSILLLTCAIGTEVFGSKTGRLAALAVSVWPSFLLHTTQLLRDPLFISATLLLVWMMILCIRRELSVAKAVVLAASAMCAVLVILLCRTDMKEILIVTLLAAGALCVITQVQERRFSLLNISAILAVTILAVFVPRILPAVRFAEQARSGPGSPIASQVKPVQSNTAAPFLGTFARRVGALRHKFIVAYPLAGSNLDTDIELNSTSDLVGYLPRAAEVGFFTPFPRMWFTRGVQVGMIGRLVSGAEMLVMYFMFGLTIVTVVQQRNRPVVWFLLIVTTVGCVALGYVVANISALYRMRYTFFILLLILGLQGMFIAYKTVVKHYGRSQIEADTTG